MRVRYTIPMEGMLRISEGGTIEYPEFIFRFLVDETTGYVSTLQLEILRVPQEEWPTMKLVEPDPYAAIPRFPFDINPNVLRFSHYLPQLLNLESLLSLFGVESFDLVHSHEEWITEDGDEPVGIQQSIGRNRTEPKPSAGPLSDGTLARLISASTGNEIDTGGVAHYRVAVTFFSARRYIDAIRYAYSAIEYLHADGQQRKKQTLDTFNASPDLIAAVNRALGSKFVQAALGRLRGRYTGLHPVSSQSLLAWAFGLRGNIQHGNPKAPRKWHPSRHEDFADEATVLINVADEVCMDVLDKRLANAASQASGT